MTNSSLVQKEQANAPSTAERMRNSVTFTPRVDILEKPDEVTLFADLPGVKLEDLDIRFERGELAIHGKCTPRQNEDVNFLSCEYGVGDFYRAFSIGEAIDANKISAELKDGVLTVHLPKSAAVKPRKIQIKGA